MSTKLKPSPGLQAKKLIMVTGENNNKYYYMFERAGGTFEVEYGRVESTSTVRSYPMGQWNKKYNEKTRKGYRDMTDHFIDEDDTATATTSSGKKDDVSSIKDTPVRKLINQLQSFATKSVKQNYSVSAQTVTESMVDSAQTLVDDIILHIKKGQDIKMMNDKLLELYMTIPRRMKNVRDHLFVGFKTDAQVKEALKTMGNEQDTLDTMAAQVALAKTSKKDGKAKTPDQVEDSILDKFGLEIELVTDPKEIKMLKDMLKESKGLFRKAYKVVNKETDAKFSAHMKTAVNKETTLFWHGSRNENWLNILKTGLLIRPSCAVYSGSMFGDGIYGASKAKKSIGYTSHRGSYWARGNANTAFMGIFEFHTGRKKVYHTWARDCYNLKYDKLQKAGYDSVHGKAGRSLLNDEYIVYKSDQVTVRYLLEIGD